MTIIPDNKLKTDSLKKSFTHLVLMRSDMKNKKTEQTNNKSVNHFLMQTGNTPLSRTVAL